MNHQTLQTKMNNFASAVQHNKTTVLLALGSVGAVTAIGLGAAVYNSRQAKTARALKRTGKVLYTVGTTMRDISGMRG